MFLALGALSSSALELETSGHSKAVLEASVDSGFKLSDKALRSLQLKFQLVVPGKIQVVMPTTLVHHQDQVGVYRLRNGFYKLVSVHVANQVPNKISVECSDLKSGDQIVSQGVALLRVVDMEAFGGEQ